MFFFVFFLPFLLTLSPSRVSIIMPCCKRKYRCLITFLILFLPLSLFLFLFLSILAPHCFTFSLHVTFMLCAENSTGRTVTYVHVIFSVAFVISYVFTQNGQIFSPLLWHHDVIHIFKWDYFSHIARFLFPQFTFMPKRHFFFFIYVDNGILFFLFLCVHNFAQNMFWKNKSDIE